jgi:hypothetical protein
MRFSSRTEANRPGGKRRGSVSSGAAAGAFHCEEEVEEEEKKTKVGGETKAGHHSCHSGLVRAEVRHGGDATV